MNLPDNPTPDQIKAVFAITIESVYTDGVTAILSGPEVTKRGNIKGQFADGDKQFDVRMGQRNGEWWIEYKPIDRDSAAFGADEPDPIEEKVRELAAYAAPTAESIQDAVTDPGNQTIGGWVDEARNALDRSSSLEDFRDWLDGGHTFATDPMGLWLGGAMTAAHLNGRDEVEED